jgi:hypothetical protein
MPSAIKDSSICRLASMGALVHAPIHVHYACTITAHKQPRGSESIYLTRGVLYYLCVGDVRPNCAAWYCRACRADYVVNFDLKGLPQNALAHCVYVTLLNYMYGTLIYMFTQMNTLGLANRDLPSVEVF